MTLSPGAQAWLGLAGFVVIADVILMATDNKTMSAVFGEALIHPVKRWPVLVTWSFLSMHLHREILPEFVSTVDPFGNAFRAGEEVWYSISGGPKSKSN